MLPSPPSPTESARLKSSEDVIDLRSQALERWAEDATNSEVAGKYWAPALGEPEAEAQPSTALVNKAASETSMTAVTPGPGRRYAFHSRGPGRKGAGRGRLGLGGARSPFWRDDRRHRATLSAHAIRRRRTPTTTWLRLVENLHRIEQPEHIGGLLTTTARRESLQLLRAGKYHSGADQMLANMPIGTCLTRTPGLSPKNGKP